MRISWSLNGACMLGISTCGMWHVTQFFVLTGQPAPGGFPCPFFATKAFSPAVAFFSPVIVWYARHFWSYTAASCTNGSCGLWHAMHVSLASPRRQHLLFSSR